MLSCIGQQAEALASPGDRGYLLLVKTAGALLAIALCLLVAREARATTRRAGESLVILTEQGGKDVEDTAFLSSVRALAAEIGIVVSTEEVPTLQTVRDALLAEARSQRKPFLVAWILREDKLRRIHLFDPWNNQLRTRTIEAGVSATANAEALALILRAELLAYLHKPSAPSPSSPTPAPSPSPSPLPSSSSPTPAAPLPAASSPAPSPSFSSPSPPSPPLASPPSPPSSPVSPSYPPSSPPSLSSPLPLADDAPWAVTASYALGTFLRGQGLQQGSRLGIVHMGRHLRLALVYGLFPDKDVAGQDVVITVKRHPVDLEIGYASREYYRLRWIAEAVVSGDWVSRHTSSAESPLTARPDAGHFLVSFGARGLQDLRLFRNVAVVLALGLDAPLDPVEFRITRGTTTGTVARLSPIRFGAELGIRIAVF